MTAERRAKEREYFAGHRKEFLEMFYHFLRFPSVSTNPAYHEHCLACADWLRDQLNRMGLTSRLLDTGVKPVVYGEFLVDPALPTVLCYGHYDVQPPDPVEAWLSPPFDPAIRDGRVYGRGAQDDKGQVLYLLKAIEYCIGADQLRCNVKVLLEGEEETGSAGPFANLEQWKDLLACDLLLVADTQMIRPGVPTIISGFRGIVTLDVQVEGPTYDLHSGNHGGRVLNPLTELCKAVAAMFDGDGGIAVEGYLDDVEPLGEEEREALASVPFDAEEYRATVGLPPTGGERGIPPLERLYFRPTLEVNGLHGGYGGPGAKTIVPARASAKISSRLAYNQDPEDCLAKLQRHFTRLIPCDLKVTIGELFCDGYPLRVPLNSAVVRHLRERLHDLFDIESVVTWSGASIPILSKLVRLTGATPVVVGFGTEAGRVHSPNESFSIEQLEMGFRYVCDFLSTVPPEFKSPSGRS